MLCCCSRPRTGALFPTMRASRNCSETLLLGRGSSPSPSPLLLLALRTPTPMLRIGLPPKTASRCLPRRESQRGPPLSPCQPPPVEVAVAEEERSCSRHLPHSLAPLHHGHRRQKGCCWKAEAVVEVRKGWHRWMLEDCHKVVAVEKQHAPSAGAAAAAVEQASRSKRPCRCEWAQTHGGL